MMTRTTEYQTHRPGARAVLIRGRVYSANTHADAVELAVELGHLTWDEADAWFDGECDGDEVGYIDEAGRFQIGRENAANGLL